MSNICTLGVGLKHSQAKSDTVLSVLNCTDVPFRTKQYDEKKKKNNNKKKKKKTDSIPKERQ